MMQPLPVLAEKLAEHFKQVIARRGTDNAHGTRFVHLEIMDVIGAERLSDLTREEWDELFQLVAPHMASTQFAVLRNKDKLYNWNTSCYLVRRETV